MELYLIRHGLAGERGTYANDDLRPLTEKGKEKTTNVAQRLLEIGLKFDLILTSPLVRAAQTAEILLKVGLSKDLEAYAPLSPDGDIQEWVKWWSEYLDEGNKGPIALVGHQPDLGNWAEMLVIGSVQEKLIVKKAGVIGLNIPETKTPLGQCELFLLISPKWLA